MCKFINFDIGDQREPDSLELIKFEARNVFDGHLQLIRNSATIVDPVTTDDVLRTISLVIHTMEQKYTSINSGEIESDLHAHAFSEV